VIRPPPYGLFDAQAPRFLVLECQQNAPRGRDETIELGTDADAEAHAAWRIDLGDDDLPTLIVDRQVTRLIEITRQLLHDRQRLGEQTMCWRIDVRQFEQLRRHDEAIVEIDQITAGLKATPAANGCSKVDGEISRAICAKVAVLDAEAARSTRRGELLAAITTASYLIALGIHASTDSLNKLLALLAVLLVEFGGGLSLAVAMGLSRDAAAVGPALSLSTTPSDDTPLRTTNVQLSTQALSTPMQVVEPDGAKAPDTLLCGPVQPLPSTCAPTTRDKVLAHIRHAGGNVRASQCELATIVGCSPSRAAQVLRELRSLGLISVRASATGSILRLAQNLFG
jgi:CRP-like cAMP-binding protein